MIRTTKLLVAAALAVLIADPTPAQSRGVRHKLDAILNLIEPKTIFVTSTTHPGNLDGLAGADAICQGLADAPGSIVPEGEYVALLSTFEVAAAARITPSSGPYIGSDGVVVADDYAALFSTAAFGPGINLINSVSRNELGEGQLGSAGVWTGTSPSGQSRESCQDWTSSEPTDAGRAGELIFFDELWISSLDISCSTPLRLYCVKR